ncbi:MAG: LysR substrate-binding domain-containing protein [Pseudomonadota bacterium]|uniref:LysR substrate-binding domain-containing protein n=1 Tax=Halomonas sp. DP5Y7-2 TaxID=2859076 RepID=UPI001C994963|nr:LysR substrate-binding domain-containing protein [Halomonas sp. DP5Y7-2]MBY5983438.1 LysR family transcriptional regulator [Halomonas sp. DP5Y7-2]MED5295872.1 LysR substrate-binding domain-containing protein [Pseudomonadota bacterium]MEE3214469.1 LysR substrate-binding domain-containing protein [Pseudomonadota bacterium]
MARQLPTMVSLACFEATARHLSMTRAAEEMSLTQSAVSRQIRNLEEMLGCELFRRVRQRLELTGEGADYLREISPSMEQIEAATAKLLARWSGQCHVGAEPSFAMRWLLPRLPAFQQRHPDIQIEIMNDLRRLYERRDGFDVAILYGDGQWPDLECRLLMPCSLVAVCTPTLRDRYGVIDHTEELLRYPLIHHTCVSSARLSSTFLWLEAAGLSGEQIEALPGQRFEHFRFVLDAALHGVGATVLPDYFVDQELADGRLVAASTTPLMIGNYYVVTPRGRHPDHRIEAFSHWLLSSIQQADG